LAGLLGALVLTSSRDTGPLPLVALTWFLACLIAESLWHPSLDGETPITMAPAAHVAALAVLPPLWGLGITGLAALCAGFLWRRGRFAAALVEAGAVLLGGGVAVVVFILGGAHLPANREGLLNLFIHHEPYQFILIALACALFLFFHQMVHATVAGTRRGIRPDRAWREAYGGETELITMGALMMVSVLAVFCYEALGYRGLLLCAMPALFVRDGSRRNLELAAAQSRLIDNERLAAKGEMAAEIGHELNNYLAAISGRAQLVLRKLTDRDEDLATEAGRIHSLAGHMAELSKGLMDFSHREVKRTAFGLNELVEKTIEFVRPQTRFRGLEVVFEPDPGVPAVDVDPGQIQQVLLTLLGRVADLTPRAPGQRLAVRTFSDERRRGAGIEIVSPEAGLGDLRPAKTEPQGKPRERDMETVHRIVERHQGRFVVTDDTGEGETFRVLLPAA
jgi:signal transduction histidine kinase